MKVENMTSSSGNKVANQFILTDESRLLFKAGAATPSEQKFADSYPEGFVVYFQSYDSTIVKQHCSQGKTKTYLDRDKWDYSKTTAKYRNQFLGESTKETQAKIDSGEYILTDLN